MDEEVLLKYLLLSIGSLLVATSFTLVGKYAFMENILYVFLGYSIFVIGYKACWYGVYQDSGIKEMKEILEDSSQEVLKHLSEEPLNYLLIGAGVYSASYGTVVFAQVVRSPDLVNGLIAGVTCFGGYIVAHEGVNEVPI